MNHRPKIELTSMWLHIIAMLLMLCDHLWATVVPGNDWLTCAGADSYVVEANCGTDL